MAVLADLKVLITRPESQALTLANQIETLGGKPTLLPCITIADPPNLSSLIKASQELNRFDMAIFISPNAVQKALLFLHQYWPQLPTQLKIGCVGQGTAQALAEHEIKVDFYPKARFNSDELLALPELQNVAGKHIVIFKGLGGKEQLADSLQQRGAYVYNAITYQRLKPQLDIAPLLAQWQTGNISIVISTSQEALTNLYQLLGNEGKVLLQQTPMLVISPVMEHYAKQLGINRVIVADNATDQAIIAALTQYRKQLNG